LLLSPWYAIIHETSAQYIFYADGVNVPIGLDFFVAFWACLALEIVAVPVCPPDPFNREVLLVGNYLSLLSLAALPPSSLVKPYDNTHAYTHESICAPHVEINISTLALQTLQSDVGVKLAGIVDDCNPALILTNAIYQKAVCMGKQTHAHTHNMRKHAEKTREIE
jgi:acyl-CoA synthetase (AMP-forming)/AMP-acid ligase II